MENKIREREENTMTETERKQIALEKFAAIQKIKRYGQEALEYQEKRVRTQRHHLAVSPEYFE